MVSLPWKNYSVCLALLLGRVSCLMCASPLPQMLPPKTYRQMSVFSPSAAASVISTCSVSCFRASSHDASRGASRGRDCVQGNYTVQASRHLLVSSDYHRL